MYQEERLEKISDLVLKKGKLSTDEIAALFNVSKDTARRDILKVVETGKVIRTHGGIIATNDSKPILNYWERAYQHKPQKQKMAKKALQFFKKDKIHFLDVSTTLFLISQDLDLSCTVYTHALDNAFQLGQKENIDLHLMGGIYNYSNRYFYSERALESLSDVLIDVAFIGAASLENDGIYFNEQQDALLKRKVIERSRKVVLVAETQKFTQSSPFKACDYNDIDIFITDKPLTNKQKDLMANIEIVQ